MTPPVRLTQFSSGAGCGCKIAPNVLDAILAGTGETALTDSRLLIGNELRDDAAAWLLDDGETLLLATTDFFMPIVDDPFDFGRIAAANAISDIYAMGGRPVLALAVLGWPIDQLPPAVAREVIRGARTVCAEASITLAGGHSLDSTEPIFGLAVNGLVKRRNLKANQGARPGDLLILTKPLGIGILATAEKNGQLRPEDVGKAAASMTRLNSVGTKLSRLESVHAMTDVTGFGLFGHLLEMCRASKVSAAIHFAAVPQLCDLASYLNAGMAPGGTRRNWASYGTAIDCPDAIRQAILSDPQTSGGLLIACDPAALAEVAEVLHSHGLAIHAHPVGAIRPSAGNESHITVI
ncbi:MAG: selenide, water dikinase SelD [Verrucomicrobia bacterium]|nr:selenide, water dikinase SelD [Verrucomicrobiota bacterium]